MVTIESFGYLHGLPSGDGLLVDLRHRIRDPHIDPEMRQMTGLDDAVYRHVLATPGAREIVTRIIEPLKAKTAALVPHAARHSLAFKAIIASRGRIDPSELILRVQGMRVLLQVVRAWRLLVRGKINPWKTLFGKNRNAAKAASRILDQ